MRKAKKAPVGRPRKKKATKKLGSQIKPLPPGMYKYQIAPGVVVRPGDTIAFDMETAGFIGTKEEAKPLEKCSKKALISLVEQARKLENELLQKHAKELKEQSDNGMAYYQEAKNQHEKQLKDIKLSNTLEANLHLRVTNEKLLNILQDFAQARKNV